MARNAKIPVEQLREQYLSGPAEESIEEVTQALKADQVVVVSKVEPHETIVFRNQRDPGIPLEFHYHSATTPFKMYKLIDGQTYTLPREVIRNLEGCRENQDAYRKNAQGVPEIYTSGFKTHFVCERA